MNQKTFFLLSASMTFPVMVVAQNGNQTPSGETIVLTLNNDHNQTVGNNPPKGPTQVLYATLDDHTLYIWSQHGGYTLTLLDDNDVVVYQTYVAAGVQFCTLPSTLSGSYTLQLSTDTYLFTGVIDLE